LAGIILIPTLIIAPAAILISYVWIRDRWEKEPWSLLWTLFGLGCISVIPAFIVELIFTGADMELNSIGEVFYVSFFAVGMVEELLKFAFVYFYTRKNKFFTEEYDGIIYAVATGLGFAFIENILYVVMEMVQGGTGFTTAVARSFTAIPLHALDGVIVGFYLGRSHFMADRSERTKTLMTGLIIAILFHGLYDFFAFSLEVLPSSIAGWPIVGLLWIMVVQWGTCHRLIDSAQNESADRWRAGINIPVGTILSRRKFCRKCGAKLGENSRFCPECGFDLGST
jgi:RsiW-degrading membrane proteinase PrsW (M82 family)